jgi:Flp pilus assembly protein TadG
MNASENGYGHIRKGGQVRSLLQRHAENARMAGSWLPNWARLRKLADDDGQSLIEFALVAPLLLLVMTGVLSFGIIFSHQVTLTQAVGVGGQYLQQIRTSTTDPCQDTFTAITNAAPNLASSGITLTLTMNGTSVTGNSCSGDQTHLVQGGAATVAATYPCQLFAYGIKFPSVCTLSAQVTEYEY